MKILQVIPYFSFSYGGPVRVVYDLAQKLAERGHDVTIYTTDVGPGHRLGEKEKVTVAGDIDVRYFSCLSNCAADRLDLQISRQMQITIKEEISNFDIVHVHEFRGLHNVWVWHYARKYATPYVLQAHGALPKRLEQQKTSFVLSKYAFDLAIGYRILLAAAKVIALTESEALQYMQMGVKPRNIKIIPNGINLSDFETLPDRGSFKKRYSIDERERIILFVGRLHKSKGIQLLLEAFKEVSNRIDNIKLIIVGPDGGFRVALEGLVEELGLGSQVLFTGWVPYREKIEALVDAELFVTPQFHGFPLTFLEACACGTPILTTTNGDKLDWIDGKIGLVVDFTKSQLRDAMLTLLTNDSLRQQFKTASLELVKLQFSIETIVQKLEDVYFESVHLKERRDA